MLAEGAADFRGAAVAVVGQGFNDDCDAARTITLVAHLLVIGRILSPGAALDGALNCVARHIGGTGRHQGSAQPRVHIGIGQAAARRGGQFADKLGEDLGALGILRAFAVHDVFELRMTGHRN